MGVFLEGHHQKSCEQLSFIYSAAWSCQIPQPPVWTDLASLWPVLELSDALHFSALLFSWCIYYGLKTLEKHFHTSLLLHMGAIEVTSLICSQLFICSDSEVIKVMALPSSPVFNLAVQPHITKPIAFSELFIRIWCWAIESPDNSAVASTGEENAHSGLSLYNFQANWVI